MSIEWNNIPSHSVADLRYACGKYGIKVEKGMKKGQIVELLENYKTKRKSAANRNNENRINNCINPSAKLEEMLMRVQPKIPAVTPQRPRKSIWLHTPSQVFGDKDQEIPIADTPEFRTKVHELTKIAGDEKKKIKFYEPKTEKETNEKEIAPFLFIPPLSKPEVYSTPDVGRKVVTPIIKVVTSPVIAQATNKTTTQMRSPSLSERSEIIHVPMRQRGKSRKTLPIFVFICFVSIVAVLLFLSQTY
jgi:hypothetical protein